MTQREYGSGRGEPREPYRVLAFRGRVFRLVRADVETGRMTRAKAP